ncbi:MAG: DUF2812 domain-containing protein, partial [Oscillospiraceae bacterium]|nr:DUF2812 domain-containing protein [Oscillospiraceae bacterium]
FYDHTGIERHLEHMAEQGWLLEKIGRFTWHYRRIEPKKLTYSVSYFPKASPFDPEPSEEQEMFYDFCAHTGWTLAAASAQLQVFRNERPSPVPIDTDPALEVEAIHKSAKKGWLISQAIFFAMAVMYSAILIHQIRTSAIWVLSSPASLFQAVCWPALLLITGVDVATYFHWRHRALRAAEQGEFLATRGHPGLQKLILAVVLAAFLGLLLTLAGYQSPMTAALMGLLLMGYVLLLALVSKVVELMKRRKASAGTTQAAAFAAAIGIALLMTAAVPFLVIHGFGYDRNAHAARPDDPVLRMEDLMDTGGLDYPFEDNVNQSPLLARHFVRLSPEPWSRDAPALSYIVYVVKAPFLYGVCKNELVSLDEPHMWYEPIDPAPWGAAEAYQEYYQDTGPGHSYILFYPERIVTFNANWELTPEQMAVAGEKLGGQ